MHTASEHQWSSSLTRINVKLPIWAILRCVFVHFERAKIASGQHQVELNKSDQKQESLKCATVSRSLLSFVDLMRGARAVL